MQKRLLVAFLLRKNVFETEFLISGDFRDEWSTITHSGVLFSQDLHEKKDRSEPVRPTDKKNASQ